MTKAEVRELFTKYAEHHEKCPELRQNPNPNRFKDAYAVIDSAFPCNCGLAEARKLLDTWVEEENAYPL